MKIITAGLVILVLVISSIVLTPSTTLQASSKGLKLYLTVDTNQASQGATIDTYQYGNRVYGHNGFVNPGMNDITLEFPSRLIDTGDFMICVTLDNGVQNCGNGYNSEEKKPEGVYVNLVSQPPQQQQEEQSQGQSQSQAQTVIVCPANARCVIEQ